MRWLAALVALLVASAADASTASDPAFLGIGMTDQLGFCSVNSITPESPAQDAGLQFGDSVFAIDGHPVGRSGGSPCTNLTNDIVAHRSGDAILLDVRRGNAKLAVKATLSTRAEVLHRRFVGERMLSTDIADADNAAVHYDLGDHGRTTIVGWFMLDRCTGCSRVFDRIGDGLHARMKSSDPAPTLLAVTSDLPEDYRVAKKSAWQSMRNTFTSSVPLALAPPDVFDALALKDTLRISFMVIDGRGIVRYVAPVAPDADADDIDAAVDDILAAAEQAEYQRTRRN